MKFTAAFLALAAGAMANKSFETSSTSTGSFIEPTPSVTYTTEIVTAITTYCPGPTTVTHGGSTYTVTEATTLTISDCPCTIKVPVTVVSSVICHSCSTPSVAPSFATSSTKSVGTVAPSFATSSAPSSTKTSPPVATAGAGKAAALSGGALAGVLGFAALVL